VKRQMAAGRQFHVCACLTISADAALCVLARVRELIVQTVAAAQH